MNKKKYSLSAMGSTIALMAMMTLGACSTDDISRETPNYDNEFLSGFRFIVNEFGESEQIITRSATTDTIAQSFFNLGDELSGTIDLVSAPTTPRLHTRAPAGMKDVVVQLWKKNSTGDYEYVRNYQGVLRNGKVYATSVSNKELHEFETQLTPNADYRIVAYTEGFEEDTNHKLTLNEDKFESGFIGITDFKAGEQEIVDVEMKHPMARLEVRVMAYAPFRSDPTNETTATYTDFTAQMQNTDNGNRLALESYSYNPATSEKKFNADATDNPITFAKHTSGAGAVSNITATGGGGTHYISYSQDDRDKYANYFMHTHLPTKLIYIQPKVGGEYNAHMKFFDNYLYSVDMNGKTIPLEVFAGRTIEENHAYTLYVTIRYNAKRYLMTDGTVGSINETTLAGGTKTPIAVVAGVNTQYENDGLNNKYMAIALHNAGSETYSYTKNTNTTTRRMNANKTVGNFMQYDDPSMLNGYYLRIRNTTHASTQLASSVSNFPAIEAAEKYMQDDDMQSWGSNIEKKWYMPAAGEWVLAYHELLGTKSTEQAPRKQEYTATRKNSDRYNALFYQAGTYVSEQHVNGFYSATANNNNNYLYAPSSKNNEESKLIFGSESKTSTRHMVRPFITFSAPPAP